MWLQLIWYYQFVTSVCVASVCVSLVCMMTTVDWHHQSLWCHQVLHSYQCIIITYHNMWDLSGVGNCSDYLISGWLIKFWRKKSDFRIFDLIFNVSCFVVVVFCLLFWGLIFFRVYNINISPLLLAGPELVLLLSVPPWTGCFSFRWFAINWL